MANWNLPTITSGYINFVTEMNDKIQDAGTLFNGTNYSNVPNGAFRFNRSINIFQQWLGPPNNFWQDQVLGIAGGGTGATNPGSIRQNLQLGTMSLQNANAVAITGGSITGISFDISSVTSGILPLARGGTGASLALAGYGSVLLSSGAGVVFDNGSAIQFLNASSLAAGTVPNTRLASTVVHTNLYQQFTFRQRLNNAGGDWPRWTMTDVLGGADSKTFEINILGGGSSMNFWALNDPESAVQGAVAIYRNGTLTAAGFGGTPLNASNIVFGTVPTANLGSGAANSTTFLRGDQVWAVPPSGGGASGTFVPSGMIGIFDTNCPAGWTRYTGLDGRFPLGSSGAGGVGGSNDHSHSFDVNSFDSGNHNHSFSGSFNGSGSGSGNFGGNTGGPSQTSGVDAGSSFGAAQDAHTHGFAVNVNLNVDVTTNIDSVTGMGGNHAHRVAGGTSGANHIPPYFTVVFCRKD